MEKIVSVDLGFGSTKIVIMENGVRVNTFKEMMSIVPVRETELSKYLNMKTAIDDNAVEHDGKYYLVGGEALTLSNTSDSVFDVVDYESMRIASVLVLKKILKNKRLEDGMTALKVSLSMAYLNHSTDFKNHIVEQLGINPNIITVVAQGAGAWYEIKTKGLNPMNSSSGGRKINNALIADIGFNTADFIVVNNGVMQARLINAKEHSGLIKVADRIKEYVKETFNADISISKAREMIETKVYRSMGVINKIDTKVNEFIYEYVDEIGELLHKEYDSILSAIDFLIIVGGFGEVVKTQKSIWNKHFIDSFCLIPEDLSEYYNAIGMCYYK